MRSLFVTLARPIRTDAQALRLNAWRRQHLVGVCGYSCRRWPCSHRAAQTGRCAGERLQGLCQLAGGATCALGLGKFIFNELLQEFMAECTGQPFAPTQLDDFLTQFEVVCDDAPRALRRQNAQLRSLG